jgi:hypothetical protein
MCNVTSNVSDAGTFLTSGSPSCVQRVVEKTYTCTVCGETKLVELEYYLPEGTPDTEGEQTTNEGADTTATPESEAEDVTDNTANGIAWWWLVIVGAAALAIGTVIGVVLKTSFKKK